MRRFMYKKILRRPELGLSSILLFSVLTVLCTFYDTYAENRTATVVRVHDGDTISVKIGQKMEKIRLIGIDAPEIGQAPWGQRARKHLKKLIDYSIVKIETDVEKRDRYGRLLAYVWTSDGRLVNLEMVREGLAVLYTIAPNIRYADALQDAQREARVKRRGIWEKSGLGESPRQYRKEHPR